MIILQPQKIAAVYVGDEGAPPDPANRDIVIYHTANNNTTEIKATSPNADPMTYPLLFFHENLGEILIFNVISSNQQHVLLIQGSVFL